ncbi:hypothetical protein ACW95P_01875 [Candidatus Mycoplasma pogonae]
MVKVTKEMYMDLLNSYWNSHIEKHVFHMDSNISPRLQKNLNLNKRVLKYFAKYKFNEDLTIKNFEYEMFDYSRKVEDVWDEEPKWYEDSNKRGISWNEDNIPKLFRYLDEKINFAKFYYEENFDEDYFNKNDLTYEKIISIEKSIHVYAIWSFSAKIAKDMAKKVARLEKKLNLENNNNEEQALAQ